MKLSMVLTCLHRRVGLARGAGVALLFAGAPALPAARPALPPVEGTYQGTAASTQGNPSTDLLLVLDPAVRRKLHGVLTLSQDGLSLGEVEVKGTVSARGKMNVAGKLFGSKVAIKGQFTPANGMGGPKSISGTYKVGRFERGVFSISSP